MSFVFVGFFFFLRVDCSALRCLKERRERERERERPVQYLLSSLSFVCELEVLKNALISFSIIAHMGCFFLLFNSVYFSVIKFAGSFPFLPTC